MAVEKMDSMGSENVMLQNQLEDKETELKEGESSVVNTTADNSEELMQLREQVRAADEWMTMAGERMTSMDSENTNLQQQLEQNGKELEEMKTELEEKPEELKESAGTNNVANTASDELVQLREQVQAGDEWMT